jgi:hypothetical protein
MPIANCRCQFEIAWHRFHANQWLAVAIFKSAIGNQKSAMTLLGSFPGALARVQRASGFALTQLSAGSTWQL